MAPTVTPTATYSYRCLGPARLEGPGGRPLSLKTRKVAALLYLLARQPGKAVAREEITELFWPGYAEAESRHSLAQTVSLINKELGGTALETYRAGGVTLREGLVTLDVTRFEAAVKAGDNEAAHALWGGRVLEGLNIPRAPDWEHWLAGERARVERLYRGVLHALGEKRRAAGDWEGMERMAETLLTFDSLDEKAMLLCLESMSLRG
ncbi:MAG TPA: BTAD domain-containing putative transcriptional regulator, partial [Gemmatimonadales bacterium]|nr:BTAD domain-containing putative transcriptional regulator [Gemmatimonadales bacterium]